MVILVTLHNVVYGNTWWGSVGLHWLEASLAAFQAPGRAGQWVARLHRFGRKVAGRPAVTGLVAWPIQRLLTRASDGVSG